jgi:ATP phosphoribosyltransferase regulatory subunit
MPRWLLPENIADVLPSEARRMEELRRQLLDLYRSYGYELVMPPLIEHLDSLLVGPGSDLALKTFQLVDQLSGRTLGVRADMTPQVTRIDAHLLGRSGVTRLCYGGPVLHTRPSGLNTTREPYHMGAELYGHQGLQADLEVLDLAVRSLQLAGCPVIRLDLAHEAILPALLGPTPALDVSSLIQLLRTKDSPGLKAWVELSALAPDIQRALLALPTLYGAALPTLEQARRLIGVNRGVNEALDELERLAGSPLWTRLRGYRNTQVEVSIDLADLRGYRYHTGISFAAYVPGQANAVVRGGRYDNVGRAFGRARAATGFSLELRELAAMQASTNLAIDTPTAAVRAPWADDAGLLKCIQGLRESGEIVIQSLPGHEHDLQEFSCDRELRQDASGRWLVHPIPTNTSS